MTGAQTLALTLTGAGVLRPHGLDSAPLSFAGGQITDAAQARVVDLSGFRVLPGIVDIQTATFDDPEAFPAMAHIQAAEQIGWMKTAHQLPSFDRYPEF